MNDDVSVKERFDKLGRRPDLSYNNNSHAVDEGKRLVHAAVARLITERSLEVLWDPRPLWPDGQRTSR